LPITAILQLEAVATRDSAAVERMAVVKGIVDADANSRADCGDGDSDSDNVRLGWD